MFAVVLDKPEKLLHIIVTDILNNPFKILFSSEVLAPFHQPAQIITQHPAVQLVPRIADEAAAVCEHSHGKGYRIQVGAGLKLSLQAIGLVIESPWRA